MYLTPAELPGCSFRGTSVFLGHVRAVALLDSRKGIDTYTRTRLIAGRGAPIRADWDTGGEPTNPSTLRPMDALSDSITLATSCTKSSTAATITGLLFVLALVGAIVLLAVLYARSRGDLAAANAELNYLRPENARLQQWLSSYTGTPTTPLGTTGPSTELSARAGWYPDPTGHHEFRYWTGTEWTSDTSDRGTSPSDPG